VRRRKSKIQEEVKEDGNGRGKIVSRRVGNMR